jgi:hypothetical protein
MKLPFDPLSGGAAYSPTARMPRAGLHTGQPLTAAMLVLVLVVQIRTWFTGIPGVFQDTLRPLTGLYR